jgi:hypothetical protein
VERRCSRPATAPVAQALLLPVTHGLVFVFLRVLCGKAGPLFNCGNSGDFGNFGNVSRPSACALSLAQSDQPPHPRHFLVFVANKDVFPNRRLGLPWVALG